VSEVFGPSNLPTQQSPFQSLTQRFQNFQQSSPFGSGESGAGESGAGESSELSDKQFQQKRADENRRRAEEAFAAMQANTTAFLAARQ
jgi:hypothetical protein